MYATRGGLLRYAAGVPRVARRFCTQHVTREVAFGDAKFTFSGPPGMFNNMSEEDFYKDERFHQFWADLGLEMFKAEQEGGGGGASEIPDAYSSTSAGGSAAQSNSTPAPKAEPTPEPAASAKPAADPNELPPPHPAITDELQLNIEAGTPVWKIKKQVEEQTGVSDSEFDLYVGTTVCEDHKVLYSYMSNMTQTKLELSIREKRK